MLHFRKITAADAAAVSWEQAALTALLPSPDYAAAMLAAGGTVILLTDDGIPAGLLAMPAETVGERPVCGLIDLVVLLPEYRRHGLGRILMGMAANEFAERGIWFLAGKVPADPTAQAFAEAIGMKRTADSAELSVLDLSDVEGLRYG